MQLDDLYIVIEDENSVDEISNSKADTINKANFLFRMWQVISSRTLNGKKGLNLKRKAKSKPLI